MSTSRTPDNQMLIIRSSTTYIRESITRYIYGKHCVHMLLQHIRVVFFFISERFDFMPIESAILFRRQNFDRIFVDFMELFVFGKKLAYTHLNA